MSGGDTKVEMRFAEESPLRIATRTYASGLWAWDMTARGENEEDTIALLKRAHARMCKEFPENVFDQPKEGE